MASPRRADDAPEVAGVHLGNRYGAFLSEEEAGTFRVSVTTGDDVAPARKQLREQRAGGPSPENEDAHRPENLPYPQVTRRARRGTPSLTASQITFADMGWKIANRKER